MITYSVISTEQESPTQSCGGVSGEAAQRRRHLPVSYCRVTNTPKLSGLRQLICFYLYGLVIYAELGWALLLMVVLADLCGSLLRLWSVGRFASSSRRTQVGFSHILWSAAGFVWGSIGRWAILRSAPIKLISHDNCRDPRGSKRGQAPEHKRFSNL